MDQNTRLEAKISKEERRTTLTMDLGEIQPLLIRILLPDQTSRMGTTIRTMEDHMINAQISHSIEAMEIDIEMNFSKIRMETVEITEKLLILHRPKAKNFS